MGKPLCEVHVVSIPLPNRTLFFIENYNMNNQQELFRRLINEDESAFKEVYKMAYRPIASYVRLHGGAGEDVEDVFQEGLMGLIRLLRKPSFTATASITTLLFSICRNIWCKTLRKRGKEIPVEEFPSGLQLVDVPELEDPEQQHEDTYQKVTRALDEMGEDCKTLILKAHYEGKRRTEIAKDAMVSEESIRIKLFRCMNRLRKILKEKYKLDL